MGDVDNAAPRAGLAQRIEQAPFGDRVQVGGRVGLSRAVHRHDRLERTAKRGSQSTRVPIETDYAAKCLEPDRVG